MNTLKALLLLNASFHFFSLPTKKQKFLVVSHHFSFIETRPAFRTELNDFFKSVLCFRSETFSILYKAVKFPQMLSKASNFFISYSYTGSPVAKRRIKQLSKITFPLFLR